MKKKIIHYSKRILRHELISASSYMFLGSMIGNICAFIFNFLLARNFTTAEYGTYASLLAIITVVSIIPQSLSTTIMKFASEYFHERDMSAAAGFFKRSLIFLSVGAVGIILLFVIFLPLLQTFFHISNYLFIPATSIIIGFYFISIIPINFLQGQLRFKYVSIANALGGLSKLLGGYLLIYLGFRVIAGLGGVAFSVLIPFILGMIPFLFFFSIKQKKTVIRKELITYGISASFTTIFLTLFSSMDLLMVKHFFSPHEAGMYAGILFIGKAILYLTSSIPLVMFPLIIKRYKRNENIHILFGLSLLLVIIPSLTATIFYMLFPNFVVKFFLGGGQYLQISQFLGLYGLFITCFSILNIFVNFFISLQKTQIAYVIGAGTVGELLLLLVFHTSFYQIISILLIMTVSMLLFFFFYYFKTYAAMRNTTRSLSSTFME